MDLTDNGVTIQDKSRILKYDRLCYCPKKLQLFAITLVGPVYKYGLYYVDISSDFFSMVNLFLNCHYKYGVISLTIMGTSYLTTVVYLKLRMKEDLYSALKYPIKHSKHMIQQIKSNCIAIHNGEDQTYESREDKIYSHIISYIEATSESILQLALSCLVIREFGISPDPWEKCVQYVGLITSLISVSLAFAQVKKQLKLR